MLICAAILAGCGSSPPTRFYTLDAVKPRGSVPSKAAVTPVKVNAVDIPALLDRKAIVRRQAGNQLDISSQDRWGASFRILTTLSNRGKRSSAELSRMFGVKPQSMIKQIAILEGNGLIERKLAKGNRRVLEVTMTEAGRVALRSCDQAATAVRQPCSLPSRPVS